MSTKMKHTSFFDVIGMKFSVTTNNNIDYRWINFILRKYKCSKEEKSILDILIDSDDSQSFMKNHLNNLDVNGIKIVSDFSKVVGWNQKYTPIPPFLVPPYNGGYILLHGCGVCSPNGIKTLIIGQSMSGKTYLSLKLVSEKKYKLITDDLIVFDLDKCMLVPYSKPIGLRESSLILDFKLQNAIVDDRIEKLEFKSHLGKSTWLIHIDDIYEESIYTNPINCVERLIIFSEHTIEIRKVKFGDIVHEICASIIESGIEKFKGVGFLIKYLSNVKDIFIVPVHSGDIISKFIAERDEQ